MRASCRPSIHIHMAGLSRARRRDVRARPSRPAAFAGSVIVTDAGAGVTYRIPRCLQHPGVEELHLDHVAFAELLMSLRDANEGVLSGHALEAALPSPDTSANSSARTASAPAGRGAPVVIRIAWPASTGVAVEAPAAMLPTRLRTW
mgnify:CR=1 FL=1